MVFKSVNLDKSTSALSWVLCRGGAIEESLFGLIEDQRHRPGIMRALRALAHALDGDSAPKDCQRIKH